MNVEGKIKIAFVRDAPPIKNKATDCPARTGASVRIHNRDRIDIPIIAPACIRRVAGKHSNSEQEKAQRAELRGEGNFVRWQRRLRRMGRLVRRQIPSEGSSNQREKPRRAVAKTN
jgi:hypothetical protein